jgi:hypothetical protein
MIRLLCVAAVALTFGFTLVPGGASAQDTNQKTLPSFVTNPWANPAVHYYQRQRQLREQKALERNIQQLQKLELLRAYNTKAKIDKQEEEALPKPSFAIKKTPPTSTTAKPGKGKLMKGAPDKMPDAVTPPENPLRGSATREGYSRTWSNYPSLIRKQ